MTFQNHAAPAKFFISLALECEKWHGAEAVAHLREDLKNGLQLSGIPSPQVELETQSPCSCTHLMATTSLAQCSSSITVQRRKMTDTFNTKGLSFIY